MSDQRNQTPTPIVDGTGRVVVDVACIRCGYSLHSLLAEGPCPGCGVRVWRLVRDTFDNEGRLLAEFRCLKCAYNLRSLSFDGKCPECGLPVGQSVRGNLLRYAQPQWVSRVARGAAALYAAMVSLTGALTGGCLGVLFATSSMGAGEVVSTLAFLVLGVAGPISAVLAIAGVLGLTSPEPRFVLLPEGLSARRACRYTMAALLLSMPLALSLNLTSLTSPPSWLRTAPVAVAIVLSSVALPLSALTHLIGLLRRLPDAQLVTHTRTLAVGILVLNLVFVLVPAFGPLVGPPGIMCFLIPCAPVSFTCLILGLFLFKRAAAAFNRASKQTPLNAAQGEPTPGQLPGV